MIIEEFSKDPSDCDDPDDPSDKCAKGQTCCKLSTGKFGCCPYDNAICCQDGAHCCPHGTRCDIQHGRCIPGLPNFLYNPFIEFYDMSSNEPEEVQ